MNLLSIQCIICQSQENAMVKCDNHTPDAQPNDSMDDTSRDSNRNKNTHIN